MSSNYWGPAAHDADDDDVAECQGIDAVVEPETSSQLRICRVAQDRLAAADHDRDFVTSGLKPVEHLLDVAIAREVDVGEGMAVAGKEFANAQRIRRVR